MSAKNEAQIRAIREGLETIVQRLKDLEKTWGEMPAEAKAELELDPKEIGKFPWRPYKPGQRSGWIFANTKGAEKLADLIKESTNGKVPIGEFNYRLSGDKGQFISRNPIK